MKIKSAIIKATISPNDNSGAAGDDASVEDVGKPAVGIAVTACVGDEVAELDEGEGVGDELLEAKFANVFNASFGFPLLSKRPKLESGLSV